MKRFGYCSVARTFTGSGESNIKDAQLTPTGVDTNYIHRHVMRSFVTGTKDMPSNPLSPELLIHIITPRGIRQIGTPINCPS
ncbi:MAG: hypothetical protein IPP04_17095 [Saprospiraceae bacterium]|nr:hypothetical protein [Saprospiraceae bacterium]